MKRNNLLKYTLIGAFLAAPIAGVCVVNVAEAVIPVIDSANINQQALTYAQTLQTVVNTAQQITLQLKELESLPNDTLNNFKSTIDTDFKKVTTVLSSSTGILNPSKNSTTVWDESFGTGTLTKDNITAASAATANSGYNHVLDQTNYDSINIIKECTKGIDDTNARIQELLDLNASAVGQKQSAQIQNMILAEQSKLLQLQNTMRAAESASRVTYYQRLNQIDANSAALGTKSAESLRGVENISTHL